MGYTRNYNAEGYVICIGRVGAYCGRFFGHRGRAWINNNASLINQQEDIPGEWLLTALQHAEIEKIKKGAAQPFVSNGDIAQLALCWPGEAVVSAFIDSAGDLFKASERNDRESQKLAETRDLLLSKFMSGGICVCEGEQITGDVS